jgi:hypothetical protein
MPESSPQPICREVFDTRKLVEDFPPRLRDRNKEVVYRIACPPGRAHDGKLVFSHWPAMTLPERFSADAPNTAFEYREDLFGYEPTPPGRLVEWYLNFADRELFYAYGGPLFAQDEMQVAEHPALGSLREALLASDTSKARTVENGQPTPVLIRGVERRCVVATDRNETEGRPLGLYGNYFSRAKAEVVERATRPIVPPTLTNLIAIEAPRHGSGAYNLAEIDYTLRTAYTGFRAAQVESAHAVAEAHASSPPEVVIHTGFWGCGAYGGNRVLMALLQFLAARLAHVNRLVFHTFNRVGMEAFTTALQTLEHVFLAGDASVNVQEVLRKIHSIGFRWRRSDGN